MQVAAHRGFAELRQPAMTIRAEPDLRRRIGPAGQPLEAAYTTPPN